ncbi:rRNA processing protein [Schizosaccharomyces japonicus yFS275]|uniref:U three protein 23 n=1 Tax=Schizosaccharomyces japonicus (strain yFS275 / FY16936) TaxID=402676 RepID=B6JV51_SCHJY|nr:rRNA processing protein [Schizosaccharomyces japonicus yFS275]EEB05252.1 rRNA processing protein [Schizosaccharomyces japonicus yFS275]
MRQKRAKSYRKLMQTYHLFFGFREPYQVVVDADFLQDLNKSKMNVLAALTRTVQGKVKPMITQCCISQLYKQGNAAASDIRLAKTFERRRCNHLDDPKSPAECIQSIVNINGKNKHRYVVATQDPEVRAALRNIPGVPLIYMKRSVVILEPASPATVYYKRQREGQQMGMSQEEKDLLSGKTQRQQEEKENSSEDATSDATTKKRKRGPKGPKGPNPLSMKKKKSETEPVQVNIIGDVGQRKKHRRGRKKNTVSDESGTGVATGDAVENDSS